MRAIGIDIGGTGIKAGRLAADGRIEAATVRATPAREPVTATIPLVRELIRELTPVEGDRPLPLGLGCAGLIDHERGRVYTSPNLPGWTGETPLRDLLAEAIGRSPVLVNDANAFVLAEARLGAGRGASSVVGLTLGTGVGGGLVLGGRLWTGCHGTAGEIGHMTLLVDGPRCACGTRGCLEALVGTRAIQERYRQAGGTNLEAARAAGDGTTITPPTPLEIAQRAARGEEAAIATFRETGRILGLALAALTHLLDPERFVLGGGVAGAGEWMLPAAETALRENVMLPPRLVPRIDLASLGPDAGWIGAALAGRDAAEQG